MAIYLYLKFDNQRFKRIFRISAISLAVMVSVVFILFRNNYYFQNIVFHTQKNSIYKSTSNNGHKQAIISGLSNIAHHPFGNGIGSAGQASVYNSKPAVISEDYFLQIGEETGVFGIVLFLAIIYFILRKLFTQKDNYSKIAFSIFSGMLIISLFWFTLSDETLCFSVFAVLAFALAKDKTSILRA